MAHHPEFAAETPRVPRYPEGAENIWHEFWKLRQPRPSAPGIRARVTLSQPRADNRQFTLETGSGHQFLIDDAEGAAGPKPIELVAAALAGCTAFDVITILREKKHQNVTGYEVRVEADQVERPPQVFFAVRIHHVVTGHEIDPVAVSDAIRVSADKYCAVQAMLKPTATISTTFEVTSETAAGPGQGLSD